MKRYGDTLNPAEFEQRMRTALKELKRALDMPYFHFVINDSLADVVREVHAIATGSEDMQEATHARELAQSLCDHLESAGIV